MNQGVLREHTNKGGSVLPYHAGHEHASFEPISTIFIRYCIDNVKSVIPFFFFSFFHCGNPNLLPVASRGWLNHIKVHLIRSITHLQATLNCAISSLVFLVC